MIRPSTRWIPAPRRPCVLLLALLACGAGRADAQTSVPVFELDVELEATKRQLVGHAHILNDKPLAFELGLEGLEVRSVSTDGHPLALRRGPGALRVRARRIDVEYTLALPGEGDNRLDADGLVLQGTWYPQVGQRVRYRLAALLPQGYDALSEASAIRAQREDHSTRFRFELDAALQPDDGLSLAASRAHVKSVVHHGGIEVATYLFPEDASQAEWLLHHAKAYLELYEALLGPYPYPRLAIFETRGEEGLSMPTYVVLGQNNVRAHAIEETALGHEIAHQWFGNSVFTDYREGNWNEGLTTYFSDYLDRERAGAGARCRKRMLAGYSNNVTQRNVFSLQQFTERTTRPSKFVGYAKGAMVLHMLRREIGDPAFFAGTRAFVRDFRFRVASWEDLRRAYEQSAGRQLGWFFQQWVSDRAIPKLSLRAARAQPSSGGHRLSFEIVQSQPTRPFRLLVPYALVFADGSRRTGLTRLEQAVTTVALQVERSPSAIVLDGAFEVMRELVPNEVDPTLERLATRPQVAVLRSEREPALYAAVQSLIDEGGGLIRFSRGRADLRGSRVAARRPWSGRPGPPALEGRRGAGAGRSSVIVLGAAGPGARRLLGDIRVPQGGFTLSIVPHPRVPGEVVALVQASDAREIDEALPKLADYRRYSFLRFERGELVESRITPGQDGIMMQLSVAAR